MTVCQTIDVDLSSPYAYLWGAKAPADEPRVANDWNPWLDCNTEGATILNSSFAVHPDDDDGTLILFQPAEANGIASVIVQGGTIDKSYRVINTVTTSDAQTITATGQIPVRDVDKQALAA